jgi:hypothetical protein
MFEKEPGHVEHVVDDALFEVVRPLLVVFTSDTLLAYIWF